MQTVAALFVDVTGPYSQLPYVTMWGVDRDARLYSDSHPIVAHPPCQLWVNFAALNFKRYGGEHNRPGNDRGCFKSALMNTRRCGGVLEHPANSNAWKEFSLQRPLEIGWNCTTNPTEWVAEVWQSAYGHAARKRTWLFYCSPEKFAPYDANWLRVPGTAQIGWFDRKKPTLSKKQACLTPPAFAEFLVCLSRRAIGCR